MSSNLEGAIRVELGNRDSYSIKTMEFAFNRSKPSESADSVLLEKVRWSVGQRLRKQMQHLSAGFFDEVDDVLFAAGQQGQFTNESDYLKAMREIRAKQRLFEEAFLGYVVDAVEAAWKGMEFRPDQALENPSSESLQKQRCNL